MFENVLKVLEKPICNHCLGRQFGQLLSGYSNFERGKIVRDLIAFQIDGNLVEWKTIDGCNFFNYNFRKNKDFKTEKEKTCFVCDGLFQGEIDKLANKIKTKLEKFEFDNFLIGSKPSKELIEKEEWIWETLGIEYCEPIRAEINREIGKRIEKTMNKKAEFNKPEINVLVDLDKNEIQVRANSVYVSGYYQKLARGIPQSRWGTPRKYKTSIEEEIGRHALNLFNGKDHRFHGAGREDIDARCLGWRPFVLEILEPEKRKIDLKKLAKLVNKTKKISVKDLKFSDFEYVVNIKSMKLDKTYRVLIKLDKKIEKKDLGKLSKIRGEIKQETPERVLHRRADLKRKRIVKNIKFKLIDGKTIEMTVKTSAGLYIKELITGDNGRTKPSISELLNRKAVCKKLDVLKIEKLK